MRLRIGKQYKDLSVRRRRKWRMATFSVQSYRSYSYTCMHLHIAALVTDVIDRQDSVTTCNSITASAAASATDGHVLTLSPVDLSDCEIKVARCISCKPINSVRPSVCLSVTFETVKCIIELFQHHRSNFWHQMSMRSSWWCMLHWIRVISDFVANVTLG